MRLEAQRYNEPVASTSTTAKLQRLPALKPAVDRFFDVSLFTMVLVGFLSLASTGKLDVPTLLLVLVALGARAWQFLTANSFQLSVEVTSRLTILYFAFGVLDFFFISGEIVSTSVHVVLFVLVVKLFSLQTRRDHLYLAVISFLMILSAAILTVDGFFLLVAATTFISLEIKNSMQNALDKEGSSIADDTSATAPKRLSKSLTKASAWMVVSTVIVATAIFFLLPRTSAGYMSTLAQRNDFASGFSDEVKLGEIGRIQLSSSVVMRVRFNSKNVPHDLHWRGVALANFDGTRWFNRQEFVAARSGQDGKLD